MTRNNSVEAGAEYQPAAAKPVESFSSSTYVASELSQTSGAASNSINGAESDGSDQSAQRPDAQVFSETLFGPSATRWGAKSSEPAELDFGTENGDKTNQITPVLRRPAETVTHAPEQVAGLFNPTEIAKTLGSFFTGDQEAARIVEQAKQGKANLDAQDAQYLKQWRGPADNSPPAPPGEGDNPERYTHKNKDGSSYEVTNGKISSFTTSPTKDNPEGLTYKNINYDSNNQITSYETPFNQRHNRLGTANKDGFAVWQSTTLDGKHSAYAGAGSSTWTGKPAINERGFHNLVSSGTYAGNMYSRGMDGSYSLTQPQYRGREMTGLKSSTTFADNTEVSRSSSFDRRAGKLNPDNMNVSVDEGDGPKLSKVSFDETGKGKVVDEQKKPGIAGGDSTMGMFNNLLSNAPEILKDVESFEIQKTGKNSFHIEGDLANVYMQPPNVRVGGFGPLGRVSATPQGGHVDKLSLDLGFNDSTVTASNIEGVNGTANLSRKGIRGRQRGIGSTSTSTTGMVWDTVNNTMTAQSPERNTVLSAQNFAPDSFNGRLLGSETAEAKAKETLKSLDQHINSAKLRQVKPGVFEGSLDLADHKVSIDTKIPGVTANLYMDDKIDFSLSKDGISFKPGEVQLGTQIGNGLESRKSVSTISRETNSKGETVMKIEFHDSKDGRDAIRLPVGDSKAETPKIEARSEASSDFKVAPVVAPHRATPQQFHYDAQPGHRRFRRR